MTSMLYRLSLRDSRRIMQARKDAGITQVDLAKKLKCTQSYIAKVENAKDGVTSEFFVRLCKELGLKPVVVEPKAKIGG